MNFGAAKSLLYFLLPILFAISIVNAENVNESNRQLVHSVESLYNNIYVFLQGNHLSMTFGHNRKIYTESVINLMDLTELPVVYTRFMTSSVAYTKKHDDILMIGLGGGRISWYLHHYIRDAHVVAVELDPEVVKIAKKYFHIPEDTRYEVITQDGRLFLMKDPRKYDIILIDAYRGPFVPFHLLTKEFYELVNAHLKDGGVVAQNVAPQTMLFDSAFATIRSVFPQVDVYPARKNAVIIANRGPRYTDSELERLATASDTDYGLRYPLAEMIRLRQTFVPADNAMVLVDDFAPVNALRSIKIHNRPWK